MDFDSSLLQTGDGSFTFGSLVEANSSQNIHPLFFDFNSQILENFPSYCSSVLDGACLPSVGNGNTRQSVKQAIESFDQYATLPTHTDTQQNTMQEDNNQCMIDPIHFSHSSFSHVSTSVVHAIDPCKSFPSFNELSNLYEDSKLFYGERTGMGINYIQMNKSGGGTNKITNVVKGQWTHEEDRLLIRLVERYGTKSWSNIAQAITGRIGKQCRERWHNHLKPDIKVRFTSFVFHLQ